MSRSVNILVWILLGALAAGGSVGYVLRQSNFDRQRLLEETRSARAQAEEIKAVNAKVAAEANQKLNAAASEIAQAQQTIQRLQEERELMSQAEVLKGPTPLALKRWAEYFSIPLGITLHLPPLATGKITDETLIATVSPASQKFTEHQWLSIGPYRAAQEQDISSRLQAASPVNYLIQGRLLRGLRGRLPDTPGNIYLLRVQTAASSTHLIWAKTVDAITDQTILETLATLSFRS